MPPTCNKCGRNLSHFEGFFWYCQVCAFTAKDRIPVLQLHEGKMDNKDVGILMSVLRSIYKLLPKRWQKAIQDTVDVLDEFEGGKPEGK